MARKERHVEPNQQGGWDVKKSNSEKNQGAECVVHSKDGKIQYSYNHSKDPLPPRDQKERHVIPDPNGGWIVTRRGFVVPLDKGKEGIHKKFDEVLNTSPD